MQNLKLPITLEPLKSAQRRLVCDGIIMLSGLERLLATTERCDESMQVNLQFDTDEQGLVVIKGKGSTQVELICQRCNEAFSQELDIDFCYSPVKNAQQAEKLPSYYDAIELDENGEINIPLLIEDELLLAMPLIPKHDVELCGAPADSTWGELPEELERPNPFDVLKKLK